MERIVNGNYMSLPYNIEFIEIGKIGLVAAIVTMLALVIHNIIVRAVHKEAIFSKELLNDLVDALVLGITIVVMAVPEGLPLAVTISLAHSVGKMRK